MRNYLTTFIQIAPWYIKNLLNGGIDTTAKTKLPEKILGYALVKDCSSRSTPFATGIYKDTKKTRVVIKLWEGNLKSVHYLNLLHQIDVAKSLTDIQERLPARKKFGFATPRYINNQISRGKVIFVMEYVPGDSMEKMKDAQARLHIYERCLKFLKSLSDEATDKERKIITTKSGYDFLFLYFFLLPAAIAMQPKLTFLLLSGVKVFLAGIPHLMKLKPNRLVHGDLHPDNILISARSNYLIDTENMRFCYPEYEPINAMSLKGNSKKLSALIALKFIHPATRLSAMRKVMASLIVNNITHNLTGDSRSENVRGYIEVFKYGLSL